MEDNLMGLFFKDLKDDLSESVNNLPDDTNKASDDSDDVMVNTLDDPELAKMAEVFKMEAQEYDMSEDTSSPETDMGNVSDKDETKEDIKNFEVELNVKIPAGMKNFYLKFNGGMPSPYCFQPQDEDLDWVEINAFFPIKERTNAFETIEVIAKDIWSRNLMPCNLLPFAMDSGGNYYALNLKNKKIYYYLTDEWDENASREYNFETNTRYIAQSFNYFINHFIEEEE